MTRRKINFQHGHFYIKERDKAGNEKFRDLSTLPGKFAANFINKAIKNSRGNEAY